MGTPSSAAACAAPATISPGALSPPSASTAIGSTEALVDFDGLAAAVPAAVAAHDVGQLGGVALRADAAGRRLERPVGGPPGAGLHLRGLLLGDGHRCRCLALFAVGGAQLVEDAPPRIHRG